LYTHHGPAQRKTGFMKTVTRDKSPLTIQRRIENAWLRLQRDWRIWAINRQVKTHTNPDPAKAPVVLFNASTRLNGFSQNAAFNLLATWGLQLADIQVVHFTCHAGMSRCVLGTNPDDHTEPPPCEVCIPQSKRLQRSSQTHWFEYQPDSQLSAALAGLGINDLSQFKWTVDNPKLSFHAKELPLGPLVLPALRWALRRHHFLDDEPTRFLLREYIQSAYRVAVTFDELLGQICPQVVVIFNGIMFPEATVRWVALNRGLQVITHEVGFQPFSAFFTTGQATAYPMDIPPDFNLSPEQNSRLDIYLSQRFQGEFTMAGVRFWPRISGLSEDFLKDASQFEQIVPVFTNVINDTSQVHACSVFSHMYDWLAQVVEVIQESPETLFVIRAHPDEKRRGTRKHSRQPVSDWVAQNGVDQLPNVVFVDSNEPLSSYELIKRSKFVIVYNSSIGLEAALLGIPVVCGGKARYTQYPTVFFPQTPGEYQNLIREFLAAKHIDIPPEFQRNARRVLYWQLFRTSVPLDRYLRAHPTPGYVQLKRFSWRDLGKDRSTPIRVLVEGIVGGKPFILPE
jgi:hypothetical protein